jgi:hypothetical protein
LTLYLRVIVLDPKGLADIQRSNTRLFLIATFAPFPCFRRGMGSRFFPGSLPPVHARHHWDTSSGTPLRHAINIMTATTAESTGRAKKTKHHHNKTVCRSITSFRTRAMRRCDTECGMAQPVRGVDFCGSITMTYSSVSTTYGTTRFGHDDDDDDD